MVKSKALLFLSILFLSPFLEAGYNQSCVDFFMLDRGPRKSYDSFVIVRGVDVVTGKEYSFFRVPRSGYYERFYVKAPWRRRPSKEWEYKDRSDFNKRHVFELETGEFLIINAYENSNSKSILNSAGILTTIGRIPVTDLLYRYGRREPYAKSHRDLVADHLNELKFSSVPQVTRFIADHHDQLVDLIVRGNIHLEDLTIDRIFRVRNAKTGEYYEILFNRDYTKHSIVFKPGLMGETALVLSEYKKKLILLFPDGKIFQILGMERGPGRQKVQAYKYTNSDDLQGNPDYNYQEF